MRALTNNRLTEIAENVNIEFSKIEGALREGFSRAVRVGELLTEAKQLVKHGDWGKWIADNCQFSERTAQNYMRLAERYPELAKSATVADLTYREAIGLLAEPKTELEQALQYERELIEVQAELEALGAELSKQPKNAVRLIGIVKEAEHLESRAAELKLRAERGAGRCFTILEQSQGGEQ